MENVLHYTEDFDPIAITENADEEKGIAQESYELDWFPDQCW